MDLKVNKRHIKTINNMADYGEVLEDYNPQKNFIYEQFVKYFKSPSLTKVKNEGDFSMYVSKIYCLLNNECRYIVAIVHIDDNVIGTSQPLSNLQWVSFQTRTLREPYHSTTHSYTPKAEGPLNAIINRFDINDKASTYLCDELQLIVTLLHTAKRDAKTYQNRGTVIAALETWETIITFKE